MHLMTNFVGQSASLKSLIVLFSWPTTLFLHLWCTTITIFGCIGCCEFKDFKEAKQKKVLHQLHWWTKTSKTSDLLHTISFLLCTLLAHEIKDCAFYIFDVHPLGVLPEQAKHVINKIDHMFCLHLMTVINVVDHRSWSKVHSRSYIFDLRSQEMKWCCTSCTECFMK